MRSHMSVRSVKLICVCFPGSAVPPGYRPRFPDRGEGCLGESTQRWRRRQLLWFWVPVATSLGSRNGVQRPAGSDRPGLSTDAGKTSRTSNNLPPNLQVLQIKSLTVLIFTKIQHSLSFTVSSALMCFSVEEKEKQKENNPLNSINTTMA